MKTLKLANTKISGRLGILIHQKNDNRTIEISSTEFKQFPIIEMDYTLKPGLQFIKTISQTVKVQSSELKPTELNSLGSYCDAVAEIITEFEDDISIQTTTPSELCNLLKIAFSKKTSFHAEVKLEG